jgi:hypothetical protein
MTASLRSVLTELHRAAWSLVLLGALIALMLAVAG